jgi:hypothetical protein
MCQSFSRSPLETTDINQEQVWAGQGIAELMEKKSWNERMQQRAMVNGN